MEITSSKIKLWSRLGARATFGQSILDIAKSRNDFYVMSADLAQSSGLARFREEYGDRFINTGIAEQNLIGVAAGLAKDGTNVFATSFSPFITMRACEQVRMNMGYMQLNVKIVGLGSGLIMSQLGNSHYGIEDAAIMRAIPGMTVINPADGLSIYKTVEALCDFRGPVYLRLTGGPNLPIVYENDYEFEIGKNVVIKDGKDICIFACGTMVYYAKLVAELLIEHNIDAKVIDVHTIKPIDTESIMQELNKKLIVSIEEASTIGGLGAAISECLVSKHQRPLQLIFGINDFFPHAGSYQYLLDECGLTTEKISSRIIQKYKELE